MRRVRLAPMPNLRGVRVSENRLRSGWLIAAILFAHSFAFSVVAADEHFPRPAELEPAIAFWTRVYTEVDTRGGFIHDSERLDIIYETVRDQPDSNARRRHIDAAVERYRRILTKLGRGSRDGLSTEEQRILRLFPSGTSNAEFTAAAQRLRFQLGQADRFRAGLARSGTWRAHILGVLDAHGVPRELVALPHVESSFDPTAYSKAGAAGMWQFTRGTGLRYMQIDHIVDERRDPYLSTEAAARLLRDNHEVIGHWPLAITAYNHGLAGMRRAVSELGTTDIGQIVMRYKGRAFGFASRNFYAAFLAAVDIDADPARYFGPVQMNPPGDTVVTPTPHYLPAATVARTLGLSEAELRRLNPALSEIVWSGDKYVPRGFPLRLPARLAAGRTADSLFGSIPAGQRFAAQLPDVEHRVSSGETLSHIAARYRVSTAALVELNGLRSSHMIRVGQVLRLPVSAGAGPVLAAAEPSASVREALAEGEYVVRRGDSIERIANHLGVDQNALLAANDIADRHRIYIGQRLRLPGAEAASISEAEARAAVLADAGDGRAVDATAIATLAGTADPNDGHAAGPAAGSSNAAAASSDESAASSDEGAAQVAALAVAAQADAELDQEPTLESNVLASHQSELAADPSNYSVSDGRIEVQALETLGHYADWLEVRTQRLRDLNGMPFSQAVVIGQSLRLDFSRVTPEEFERRRTAYQQSRQEAFFTAYRIEEVEEHVVRRGESLWVLAQSTYEVPVWLLRQYNPDLDLDRVRPGTIVKFPKLRRIDDDADSVST